jgi:hypothetical protein
MVCCLAHGDTVCTLRSCIPQYCGNVSCYLHSIRLPQQLLRHCQCLLHLCSCFTFSLSSFCPQLFLHLISKFRFLLLALNFLILIPVSSTSYPLFLSFYLFSAFSLHSAVLNFSSFSSHFLSYVPVCLTHSFHLLSFFASFP